MVILEASVFIQLIAVTIPALLAGLTQRLMFLMVYTWFGKNVYTQHIT
jgi:hypothetical protein